MPPVGRAWLVLAPVPAALVGMAASGAPPVVFLPSLVAWAAGAAAVLALPSMRARRRDLTAWAPPFALLVIAATLLAPGLDGVHRWLTVGPVRLNASTALLPWLVVALGNGDARVRWRALACACVAQVVHVAQPDAAQASVLALASLPLLAIAREQDRWPTLLGVGLLVGLAAAAWTRPDPLPALDHVERVLVLAAARGPLWIGAALAAGLALFLPVASALTHPDRERRHLGAIVALYLAAAFAATFVGHFPVPIFGAGAGPILGWFAFALALR